MLAVSRKDRVIGRTSVLTVSTRTRKGFNQPGAPPGRSPAAKDVGAWETLDRIRDSHNGRAKATVKTKWLVVLKTYGRSPARFRKIRLKNKEIRIACSPERCVVEVREA